jgi:hypothetical protein
VTSDEECKKERKKERKMNAEKVNPENLLLRQSVNPADIAENSASAAK